MTITKDSAKLYKFLKDETERDAMQSLEHLLIQKMRWCYSHTDKGVYLDFSIVSDYFRSKHPALNFNNQCRKFDDL